MWSLPRSLRAAALPKGARSLLLFTATAVLAASVTAHVRLRYSEDGTPLRWEEPENISIVIQRDGSDDLTDGSHETAIESAIEEWNSVYGTRARLVIDDRESSKARQDWQNNNIHLVVFDENGSSGYFSGASGIVAITPVSFFTDGRIIDADVVFNGKNFRFTTSGETGHFDIQDVAAHELGHLIGLDHSGVCGATMYPYVDPTVILHRSLAIDDQNGLRHIYPAATFGKVDGRLVRSDESGISGAHIVALDADGRVAGAILAGDNGSFRLQGLLPGQYTIYADPLDQPVSTINLGGGQTIQTDFSTTDLGSVTIGGGEIEELGTHVAEADASLSLGRVSDDYPLRVIQGRTVTRTVRGSGLNPSSTLACSDPTVGLTNVSFAGSSVTFSVTVPAGARTGHLDLVVTDISGQRDTLVGGLEVTPPNPLVLSADPAVGDADGGVDMTIVGENFRAGARVVVGNRIYRDGAPGGCTVVDSNTILLQTAETIAGVHDVVVIDPSGVEGRSQDPFNVAAEPEILSVFPVVGSASGGTTVTIAGEDFVPGLQVEIDGVLQADVFVDTPTRMRVVTSGGVPGGPYILRVSEAGGLSAESAFSYAVSPDPTISTITPDTADNSGGTLITVYGTGFNESSRVVFGGNVLTGSGGNAGNTDFLSSGSLQVTAPSSGVGTKSIIVQNVDTGQAAAVSAGFTYTGDQPLPDDGGGCAAVIPPLRVGGGSGPPSLRAVASGSGWILLLMLLSWWKARGAAVRPAAAA
jgi:hypothetical protein